MNNETSIEVAWHEYKKQLLNFVHSKVDTLEDAEDIVNEVFIALINKAKGDKTPEHLASWLYGVTRNKVVDYYRSRKMTGQLPEEFLGEVDVASLSSQLSSCLLPMIKALPNSYQQPLILSEIEGKKYNELTVELDLSLSAVKSRIIRGRKKLYQSILACCSLQRDSTGNINFYSTIFGNKPSVVRDDYAKWELQEPAVNFAISNRGHALGVNHLGIQVDSELELELIAQRLDDAEIQSSEQTGTPCCYARSNKHWALDPQGIAWESFFSLGQIPIWGEDNKAVQNSESSSCCIPLNLESRSNEDEAACCVSSDNTVSGCC